MSNEEGEAVPKTRLGAIRAKLADPKLKPSEARKLIAIEIAAVTDDMLSRGFTAEDAHIVKILGERVKALRELNHQIVDMEISSGTEEVLDFDGPKFLFAVGGIAKLFRLAMTDAGVPGITRDTTLSLLRELTDENLPRMRKEVEHMGRRLGMPRAADPRPEAVVSCESQKARVVDRLLTVVTRHHDLGVVVEAGRG